MSAVVGLAMEIDESMKINVSASDVVFQHGVPPDFVVARPCTGGGTNVGVLHCILGCASDAVVEGSSPSRRFSSLIKGTMSATVKLARDHQTSARSPCVAHGVLCTRRVHEKGELVNVGLGLPVCVLAAS